MVHDVSMRHRTSLMSGLLCVMTMACASEPGGPEAVAGTGSAVPQRPFSLDDAVQAARTDAAKHTGLAAEALVLISAERVNWSDGSIGCPEPGKSYMQVLVPGYRVRLRGPAGEFNYHATTRGPGALCPAKRAVNPLPGVGSV